MPVQYPFNDWLAEMSAESLEFPEEVAAGAIANMWSMSFGAGRLPDSAELKRFIDGALALRRSQAQRFEGAPVTFYLWHDEQAGQLRFSVARCVPGTLPFHRSLTAARSMDEIVDRFLASTRVDGRIPWSELELEDSGQRSLAVQGRNPPSVQGVAHAPASSEDLTNIDVLVGAATGPQALGACTRVAFPQRGFNH